MSCSVVEESLKGRYEAAAGGVHPAVLQRQVPVLERDPAARARFAFRVIRAPGEALDLTGVLRAEIYGLNFE